MAPSNPPSTEVPFMLRSTSPAKSLSSAASSFASKLAYARNTAEPLLSVSMKRPHRPSLPRLTLTSFSTTDVLSSKQQPHTSVATRSNRTDMAGCAASITWPDCTESTENKPSPRPSSVCLRSTLGTSSFALSARSFDFCFSRFLRFASRRLAAATSSSAESSAEGPCAAEGPCVSKASAGGLCASEASNSSGIGQKANSLHTHSDALTQASALQQVVYVRMYVCTYTRIGAYAASGGNPSGTPLCCRQIIAIPQRLWRLLLHSHARTHMPGQEYVGTTPAPAKPSQDEGEWDVMSNEGQVLPVSGDALPDLNRACHPEVDSSFYTDER
jgi:hypothetical protein